MKRLVLAMIVLSGCSTANLTGGDRSPAALQGVTWQATEIAGSPITPKNRPSLTFKGGDFSGQGFCNHYFGKDAFLVPGRIDLRRLGHTLMACLDGELMALEGVYFTALQKVTTYRLESDGSLSLLGPDGTSIRFRKAATPSPQRL
jgi:heat shock protein HslJ